MDRHTTARRPAQRGRSVKHDRPPASRPSSQTTVAHHQDRLRLILARAQRPTGGGSAHPPYGGDGHLAVAEIRSPSPLLPVSGECSLIDWGPDRSSHVRAALHRPGDVYGPTGARRRALTRPASRAANPVPRRTHSAGLTAHPQPIRPHPSADLAHQSPHNNRRTP